MLTSIWCAVWLAFVQNFNHFDSQPLENLEWRLLLKITALLQASIQPFIWARVAGPTSYLSENFEFPRCWTSEVQHPSCPPFSHYPDGRYIFFTCTRTRLSAITIKPVFWYLQIFFLVYYDWILANVLTLPI